MRIAILVNTLVNRGGADRIVLEMAKHWNADIYVGIYNPETTFQEFKHLPVRVLMPRAKPSRLNSLRMRQAFKKLKLSGYDAYVFHGGHCILAAPRHKPGIWYCHAPPRWMYDMYREEFAARRTPFGKLLFRIMHFLLKREDQEAVKHINAIITNSKNVCERVKKFYGRNAIVINPPVDTRSWRWVRKGDYYLSPARLDPIKRINLIVKAFQKLPDHKLVVASSGPDLKRIRKLAAGFPNIRVLGRWCSDEEIRELYGSCIAVIAPSYKEDFGMVAIEANATGKPVIATNSCGFRETIIPGKAGLLVDEPVTPEKIRSAVLKLTPARASRARKTCEIHAKQYELKTFLAKLDRVLQTRVKSRKKTVYILSRDYPLPGGRTSFVKLLTSAHQREVSFRIITRQKDSSPRIISLSRPRPSILGFALDSYKYLRQIRAKGEQIDIIFGTGLSALGGLLFAKIYRIPSIFNTSGIRTWSYEMQQIRVRFAAGLPGKRKDTSILARLQAAGRLLVDWSCAWLADVISVPASYLIPRVSWAKRKTVLIAEGTSMQPGKASRGSVLRKIGYRTGDHIVTFCRISDAWFSETLTALRKRFPNLKVLNIRDRDVQALGSDGNMKIVSLTVKEAFSVSDLVIIAPESEPHSCTALEALLLEVPVVVSNVEWLREEFKQFPRLLLNELSAEAIVQTVDAFYKDPRRFRTQMKSAKQHLLAKYDPQEGVRGVLALVKGLTDSKRRKHTG